MEVDNVAFSHMVSEKMRTRLDSEARYQLVEADAKALAFSKMVHLPMIIGAVMFNVYYQPFALSVFTMFWPPFWVGGVADCIFAGGTPVEMLKRIGVTTATWMAGFLCFFIQILLVIG